MPIQINKKYFARDRQRENDYGSFFNRTSTSIQFFMNVIIAGIFTPAVMATSLASKAVILMLANISLCLGYTTNFIHRVLSREVGIAEFVITLLGIAGLITLAFYFLPVTLTLNMVGVISLINHVATAINGFFLIRNIVVPPLKKGVEGIAKWFGCEIKGNYYYRRPLNLEIDRHVIDNLFRQAYGKDTTQFEREEVAVKLKPFNNMIEKLSFYINKYNEALFGSISEGDKITNLDKFVAQITIEGNAANATPWLKRKEGFKLTKQASLKRAREALSKCNDDTPDDALKEHFKFFTSYKKERLKTNKTGLIRDAIACYDKEIQRQQEKIDTFEACKP